ncbi:MAG TPA: hypothetical protein VGE41_10110 [Verrucomicrobiae bacterium]
MTRACVLAHGVVLCRLCANPNDMSFIKSQSYTGRNIIYDLGAGKGKP